MSKARRQIITLAPYATAVSAVNVDNSAIRQANYRIRRNRFWRAPAAAPGGRFTVQVL